MSKPHEDPRVMPPDSVDDESFREYGRQLAMDSLLSALLGDRAAKAEEDAPADGRRLGSSARLGKRSSVMAPVSVQARFWNWKRLTGAAALLLIVTGAALLWFAGMGPADRLETGTEEAQRATLLQEVEDWEQALSAVRTPAPTDAVVPSSGADPDVADEASVVARRAEADEDEVERFIKARRDFVLRQLHQFEPRRPQADLSDDDEYATPAPSVRDEPVLAHDDLAKVGRVLAADAAGREGTLVRATGGIQRRLRLEAGVKLQTGDRIETSSEADEACTSVSLDGGATLDLDRDTVIEVLGRDALRLQTGRIYAHIVVPSRTSDRESAAPFALQTDAGRFLAQEVEAEIYATPKSSRFQGGARVDQGKVHLVNRKGHVVGTKGQELRARKDAAPTRDEGFSSPIWRGRARSFANLPFGPGCPVIISSPAPARTIATTYALALAHRGELRLAGIQASLGSDAHQEPSYRQCVRDAQALGAAGIRGIPPPVLGATRPLRPPPSGKLDETLPTRSAAALQILACVRTATPDEPVLFICSGAVTDLASAWLIDRAVADRVVVMMPSGGKRELWWKQDDWSAEIILRHFRCIFVAGSALTVDRARLQRIGDPRWAALLRKETDSDDEFHMLVLRTSHDPELKVSRVRFAGFHHERPTFSPDPQGSIWRIRNQTEGGLLQEFERVFLSPPVR